ncbi:7-cyano-7-deazaguanine synthase QueC [bacterium]|nr:7-cyano-7-deazaguanine synthase QueC [bacterium]
MSTNNNALVLLSGGLDSFIALDIVSKKYNIIYAINFNYGQKAFKEEYIASEKIAKKYNIELKTLELPYLKELCNNALTDPNNNSLDEFSEVWIPNRNGLFLNIAASYCDKLNIKYIIMGLNLEEAQKFPDNSEEFIKTANQFFKYSTLVQPEILAPCKNMSKVDIINYAIDNKLDLKLIKSCYNSLKNTSKKHCLECMSCKLLYNAVRQSKNPDLVKELF